MKLARATAMIALMAFSAAPTRGNVSDPLKFFVQGNVSLSFSKKYFDSAELKTVPRKVHDNSLPVGVGPERWEVRLTHPNRAKGAKDHPRTLSVIYITPLRDKEVPDFGSAYPQLAGNAQSLRELLSDKPNDLNVWSQLRFQRSPQTGGAIPDEPFNNSAACLLAKFRAVRNKWGTAVRFLTYYRQEADGIGATNLNLTYNVQAMTSNSDFYVSARLDIAHPKLADSVEDPRAHSDQTNEANKAEYDRINRWNDDSFNPPLTVLDAMIASVRIRSLNNP